MLFLSALVPRSHLPDAQSWLFTLRVVVVGMWLFWATLRQRREGPVGTVVAFLLFVAAAFTPHSNPYIGLFLDAVLALAAGWLFWPVLWRLWTQITEEVSL